MTRTLDLAGIAALLLAATPAAADGPPQDAGYAYRIEGRRDPFVKSYIANGQGRPDCASPGLAGLLIGEMTLRGIVLTRDGPVAMLVGPDGAAQFGRVGDRLCDGAIAAIPPDRIVYARKTPAPGGGGSAQRVEVRLWPSGPQPGDARP